MKLLRFSIFVVMKTIFYGIKVPGNFEYCPTKDFCEIIKEIDVVETFNTCTKFPFVKFFSKAANKILRGFADPSESGSGVKQLVTQAQETIPCDLNKIKEDAFDGFNIVRVLNKARVDMKKNESDSKSTDKMFLIVENYFSKPLKYIIRDILLLVVIFVVFSYIIKKLKLHKFNYCSLLTSLCLCISIISKLISKHKNKKSKNEDGPCSSNDKHCEIKLPNSEKSKINLNRNQINAQKESSDLIADDEDDSNYINLNRAYFTPCGQSPQTWSPKRQNKFTTNLQKINMNKESLNNHSTPIQRSAYLNHNNFLNPQHLTPSAPTQSFSFQGENVQSNIRPLNNQYNLTHQHNTPQFMIPSTYNSPDYTPVTFPEYIPPNYMNSMLGLKSQTVPPACNRLQTLIQHPPSFIPTQNQSSTIQPLLNNGSPPFAPIVTRNNGENAACPISGCGKSFKGVKGIKAHARYQHHDFVFIIKNGLEGFIPK